MSYVAQRTRLKGCGCHEPTTARIVAERAVLLSNPRMVRESVRPHEAPGTEPIILAAGSQSACRPFLKVEKDPAKFAACNALADIIGPLDDPKSAFKLIGEAIGNEVNEVFGVVTLDLHLRMKSVAETGRGESDAVMAPIVPTLQAALIDGAYAAIIFHVHPSGIEAKPSPADKETTKAFVKAFDACEVNLIDHIIVGGDAKKRSYYSFAEDNAL